MLESLFEKFGGLKAFNFIYETPTQVFSCEIWEIFKNNFFYRTPPEAASKLSIPKINVLVIKGNFSEETIVS